MGNIVLATVKTVDYKHVAGYTLIAIIEAYISVTYGDIFWKTANLNVDAGTTHGSDIEAINYAELSRGVQNARQTAEIELPSINGALKYFEVGNKTNILFPVGAISGTNQDLISRIEQHQPYVAVMEFVEKVKPTDKQMSLLIKAGAFREFEQDNYKLAIKWLKATTDRKKKLTTVQLPRLMNDLPSEFNNIANMYRVKNALWGRNKIKMNDKLEQVYLKHYSDIPYEYIEGVLTPDKKAFDKAFNKISTPLKEWLKSDQAIDIIFNQDLAERWNKLFYGNKSSWAFEALSYYPNQHEIELTSINKLIDNFGDLPQQPEKLNNGRINYKKVLIAGTVLSYNSKKGVVDLYTTDGYVIPVGIGKNRAAYYAKRIAQGVGKNRHIVDDSWFKRNNKLAIVGYRRDNKFQLNNTKTVYDHGLLKINGYDGNTVIQQEKMKEN